MKKRLISLLLIASCMLCFCSSALAFEESGVKFIGKVSAGLDAVSGNTYSLWGKITGAAGESLSVRVILYKGSTYIAEVYKPGIGPTIYTSKNVALTSGDYRLDIIGTTSTRTITGTRYITIDCFSLAFTFPEDVISIVNTAVGKNHYITVAYLCNRIKRGISAVNLAVKDGSVGKRIIPECRGWVTNSITGRLNIPELINAQAIIRVGKEN